MNILNFMGRVLFHREGHAPPVPDLNAPELKVLRQVFDSHCYGVSSMQENDKPDLLKTLFGRGSSINPRQARELFHPLDLDRLIESGLLYKEGDEIKAHLQAQAYDGLILFSDFFHRESDRDFVLPVGPAGKYLALLTIRRHVAATLDLGCGCGIQSLLAARHSDRVIATDINPRALALTRFNAEWNELHNIETRLGSYFDPVRGQCFDLILANLPYVISPEKRMIYRTVRHPNQTGLDERLKEIPAHLTEGGFAQMLINWVHEEAEDPAEPIQQALGNRDVDVWLIHNGSKGPGEYAGMWLRSESPQHQRTKENWLDWYRSHHIERIALGAITLRRRSGRNWFCSDTVNRTLETPAGEQFLRLFALQDYLRRMENPQTLLSESFAPIDLGFTESESTVYSRRGSHFELRICPASKAALQGLDGEATLAELIESIAHKSNTETTRIQSEVLADFQELMKLGMLVPSSLVP